MNPNTNLPALSRSFAGFDITVPAVYAPGDSLTAPAAGWVNGQLATVLGNAFGGTLRRAEKAGKALQDAEGFSAQALFDTLFAEYSFEPSRKGERATRDPVEALMLVLAKEDVKARILKKGLKVKDFMAAKITVGEGEAAEEISKFTDLVEQYIDRNEASLRARAEASLAATTDDDFDAEIDAEAAPVAQAAE